MQVDVTVIENLQAWTKIYSHTAHLWLLAGRSRVAATGSATPSTHTSVVP